MQTVKNCFYIVIKKNKQSRKMKTKILKLIFLLNWQLGIPFYTEALNKKKHRKHFYLISQNQSLFSSLKFWSKVTLIII